MLLKIIANLEHFDKNRALGEKQPNGMRRISYGFPAHVLDAIRAMWEAFDNMGAEKVENCCIKSGILSYKHLQDLFKLHDGSVPRDYADTPGGKGSNHESQYRSGTRNSNEVENSSYDDYPNSIMDIVDALCASSSELEIDAARGAAKDWADHAQKLEEPRMSVAVAVSEPEKIVSKVYEFVA